MARPALGATTPEGYTTVDLISQWKIDSKNRVSLGVENLLNRNYFPLYSQLLRNNNNTSRLPAAGTVCASAMHTLGRRVATSEPSTNGDGLRQQRLILGLF
jgi:outer membrane receptor for ferrienterochelin and colicin